MNVWGISMVKDESDVIEGTVRHMADEVDYLLVADNLSTDGTRGILDKLADELRDEQGNPRLTVVDDPDPAYEQSRKMTALAEKAAADGAQWILPFDADELWVAPDRISTVLAGLDCSIAYGALFNHLRTAVDEDDPDPFRSMVWRQREPMQMPKVAFRWEPGCVIHQGNHAVTRPSGGVGVPALEIRHFPVRSAEQFARKSINGSRAYQATSLHEVEGAHWRAYGRLYKQGGEKLLHDVFRQHWWYLSPVDAGLVYDPATYRRWQSAS